MRITIILAAMVLALAPGFASAEGGCHNSKSKLTTASSCKDGYSWDQAKAICVTTPSS